MNIIALCTIICIIAKCIIFNKRDVKWWKALIPGYNFYILGKLSNKPKLGILNAVFQLILTLFFLFCFCFEVWIIQNYSSQIMVPNDMNLDSKIVITVPKNIANIAVISKYILIILGLITVIVWCKMMWHFTKIHKRSPWWILLWFAIPAIPYCAFALNNEVVIDNKRYTMKRVEVNGSRNS